MKYRTTLMSEIDVEFITPDITRAYFIDGTWKDTFYTFYDLQEFAENIAYMFNNTPKSYKEGKGFIIDIEGFPYFEQNYEDDYYFFNDEECGEIRVRFETELEIDDCEKIN